MLSVSNKLSKTSALGGFAAPARRSFAAVVDFWSEVEEAPRDPILGVTEKFLADTNPDKMNLGVVSNQSSLQEIHRPSIQFSFFTKKTFTRPSPLSLSLSQSVSLICCARPTLTFSRCCCLFDRELIVMTTGILLSWTAFARQRGE